MKEIKVGKRYVAWVDDDDHADLAQFRWTPKSGGRGIVYAYRKARPGEERGQYMHRRLISSGYGCDHVTHDLLAQGIIDNRRSNLREATALQNAANRRKPRRRETASIFKGVIILRGARRQWHAHIGIDNKRLCLGAFRDEGYAALLYDLKLVELYGEFALTNFPVPGSKQWIFG